MGDANLNQRWVSAVGGVSGSCEVILDRHNDFGADHACANLGRAVDGSEFALQRLEQSEGAVRHTDGAEALREDNCERDVFRARDGDTNIVAQIFNQVGVADSADHDSHGAQFACFEEGVFFHRRAAHQNLAFHIVGDVACGRLVEGFAPSL